jgi:hypothetical protein
MIKQLRGTQYLTHTLLAAFVLAPCALAHATNTLNITYFTIGESDADGARMCCGVSDNYVQSSLGVNGLPVFNTGATATSGSVFTPDDLLGDGEITWWSPSLNNGGAGGTSDVTQTGTGVVTLPYDNSAFFPPNGTGSNDYSGFQAAILSGTIDAPEAEDISFSIGSDDMAFLYLNGEIACSDGGVHGATSVPCTSSLIPAGENTLELFYVDLDPTAAVLDFSVTTTDVTTSPTVTPEPGTFGLFGSGLLALAGLVRRKIGHRV